MEDVLKAIEQHLTELQKHTKETVTKVDYKKIEQQKKLFNSAVMRAGLRYYKLGLGSPMSMNCWRQWPQQALDFPGGPVAVYKEAIQKGITWEEVCGYVPLPNADDFID